MDKIDLGFAVNVEAPERCIILHPTNGEPIYDKDGQPMFVALFSHDSPRARDYNRETLNRRLARRNKSNLSAEELEAETVGLLVALVADWHLVNVTTREPITMPCNPANARTLFNEPALQWLREQVSEFVQERRNFLPKP